MYTKEDLLLKDFIEVPHNYPQPFIGMLLKNVHRHNDWYGIIIKQISCPISGCFISLDDVLHGRTDPGYQIADYGKADTYHVPGMHCSPDVDTIGLWDDAISTICEIEHTPQYEFKIHEHDINGFRYNPISCSWKEENPDHLWSDNFLPVPEMISDLIFGKKGISLDLKTQNTDGRSNCARCGGPIKMLPGFSQTFNHCPKCEG